MVKFSLFIWLGSWSSFLFLFVFFGNTLYTLKMFSKNTVKQTFLNTFHDKLILIVQYFFLMKNVTCA